MNLTIPLQIEVDEKHLEDAIEKYMRENPDVVVIPEGGIGNLSDGYHTFNELYQHRAILFSVICNLMPGKAWKSKLHDTGDMYDGMFIVGIETPEGQATYHYDIEPYWDIFKVKELEKAPKWDGHTPQDAINRISKLTTLSAEESKQGGHSEEEWEKALQNIKFMKSEAQMIPMGFFYVAECNRMLKQYEHGNRSDELYEEMINAH
jgi:hypothetical protein